MSHYSINRIKPEGAMEFLRELFPEGKADEMNLCLFSTSGVHGTYRTIEEIPDTKEHSWPRDVTFLVVHPRIVRMSYGNVTPKTIDDIDFLKKLRQSSWDKFSEIGRDFSEQPPTKSEANDE